MLHPCVFYFLSRGIERFRKRVFEKVLQEIEAKDEPRFGFLLDDVLGLKPTFERNCR